jgi:hypothetical protein
MNSWKLTPPWSIPVLSLLSACYGTVNNTGLQRQLSMGMPASVDTYGYPTSEDDRLQKPVAVGAPVAREIFRFTAHWSSCSIDEPGCGSLTDSMAKLTLVECGCANDACTCGLAESGLTDATTRLQLAVTGVTEGKTILHVKVKADGNDVEDTFAIEFRTPTKIGVYGDLKSGGSTRYASMPGATFDLMAVLEAADGTQLLADRSAYSAEVSGTSVLLASGPDVWTPKDASTTYEIGTALEAAAPGESTLRFTAVGLQRDVKLVVGDYKSVTGFELHPALPQYSQGPTSSRMLDPSLSPDDAVDAPMLDAALTEVDVGVDGQLSLLCVLQLSDGTLAIGGAPSLVLTPATVAKVSVSGEQAFDGAVEIDGLKLGQALLHSNLAPDAAGIPVIVAASSSVQ